MRILFFFITALVTASLCYILDARALMKLPLGKLLSPQEGIWQNAEAIDHDFSGDFYFKNLHGKTEVFFDERLVPHVFADNENDAYFVQGFLHAKFRLWQMELQAYAAAGRASELIGDRAINHDREFRRLGMVYAAENTLFAVEKDPQTKAVCDSYTAGVNEYIHSLTASSLPLEYKLLGLVPEDWTNLKSALFLKYMSYDLSAHERDFEMTAAKSFFNKTDFDLLFPAFQDSTDPIIPKDSAYLAAKIHPVAPKDADSVYFNFIKDTSTIPAEINKPNPANGSNNWAVSGAKTKTGAPILCNDPHLGLNLPSLWYEIQISVPGYNAYGVSFPGAPGVIIGFNDSCAFGFTNGGRDVRDYYEIKFKDETKSEYWFDSAWVKTNKRIECIKVAGNPDVYDTVAYTKFGPVMYDASFSGRSKSEKAYAVRWTAHDTSNEFKFFYLLDRAKNYNDYLTAVTYLKNPGQNCVFACKNGDIAMRTAGRFPAKWKGQGDFVMPGEDSSYLWQGMIPEDEMPYQYNPARGSVSSANQRPVDTSYEYYLGREYPSSRGLYINKKLNSMQQITVRDMMAMQTDNYNIFAANTIPSLIKNIQFQKLNSQEKKFYQILKEWNCKNDVNEKGATVFDIYWQSFYDTTYNDEYTKAPTNAARPFESTLMEHLLKDSAYKFYNNINTPWKETLPEIATAAFKKSVLMLGQLETEKKLEWWKYKDTHIDYLLKLPSMSRSHLPIGGGTNVINATTETHGPSWRMIVGLTAVTDAYGIYPGGQSGNPGSKFYDDGVDNWVAGNYYQLWMMKRDEQKDRRIKWTMRFIYYD
jgi:penicillin amidase